MCTLSGAMGISSGWVPIVTLMGGSRKIQTRGQRKIAAIRFLAIGDPIDNRLELCRKRLAGHETRGEVLGEWEHPNNEGPLALSSGGS